jgi:hypothetical protein
MSYLFDFFKTFDEEQLAQFKMLDLKGKEELVRDEYVRYASVKISTNKPSLLSFSLPKNISIKLFQCC